MRDLHHLPSCGVNSSMEARHHTSSLQPVLLLYQSDLLQACVTSVIYPQPRRTRRKGLSASPHYPSYSGAAPCVRKGATSVCRELARKRTSRAVTRWWWGEGQSEVLPRPARRCSCVLQVVADFLRRRALSVLRSTTTQSAAVVLQCCCCVDTANGRNRGALYSRRVGETLM